MEPANSIIALFGTGYTAKQVVADLLDVHVRTVYRWTWSKERAGTGGALPQHHHAKLIEAARVRGYALRFEHFALNQTPRIGRIIAGVA